MSECVVRMEMPQNGVCDGCGARTVEFLAGQICTIKKKFLGSSRPSWCPIICQLPEGHGRLVEADAIEYVISENGCQDDFAYRYDINELPTIVPAERSET